MNIVLWLAQAILAIKLITVTLTHGLQENKPTIQEASQKMGKTSKPLLLLVALWILLGTAWPDPSRAAGLGRLDHALYRSSL